MGLRFNARTNSIETDASSVDFTQPVTTPASTASAAGFNIAEGVAPSAPVDGDVWVTAAGNFNARLNGSTVDLAAGGGGGNVTKVGTPVNNELGVWTGDGTIEGDANLTYTGTSLAVYGDQTASIIDAQDETFYDNSPTTEGTFSGGTGHAALDVITLSDGSTITVDAVSTGVVTQFTVETPTVTPFVFGATLTQTGTTGSGADFSLTPDADNVEFEIVTHHLGTNATNRITFESGPNYGRIQVTDDGNDATACNLWFDLDSSTTGSHTFYWSDGGFGNPLVVWNLTDEFFRFGGGLEMTERADHASTNISGGRGQLWVKSSGGGGELMYSEGDWDVDYTVQNIITASYRFDTNTGATDPGDGDIKFDNATPSSVTNIYIDDLESTGRDNDFYLGNLASGDIIKLRSPGTSATTPRWWIGRVDGTPTDNTGWWTIPVSHIADSGSNFASGWQVDIDVDFLSQPTQSAARYFASKTADEDVTSSTTLQDDNHLTISSIEPGKYRMTMWIEIRDISGTSNTIKWDFNATGFSDANYFYSANITSSNTDLARIGVDLYSEDITQACPSGAGTGYVEFTGYFTVAGSGSLTFRWAQGTSNVSAIRVGAGSWLALERMGV